MYYEIREYLKNAFVQDKYDGTALSKIVLKSLIHQKAEMLRCKEDMCGQSEVGAIRIIQQKEGFTPCFGMKTPFSFSGVKDSRCGETRCLWKTYCEIRRRKYRKIFVSYASADLSFARELSKSLREFNVPVWFDEWEIERQDDEDEVYELLRQGVSSSDALIILDTECYEKRRPPLVLKPGTVHTYYPFKHNPAPFLSFEKEIWVKEWHDGLFFKMCLADYNSDNTAAFDREPIFKQTGLRGFIDDIPLLYRWYGMMDSYELVGEQVYIPFKDHKTGIDLLIKELLE